MKNSLSKQKSTFSWITLKIFCYYFLAISLLNFVIYINFAFHNPSLNQIEIYLVYSNADTIAMPDVLLHILFTKSFMPGFIYALLAIFAHTWLLHLLTFFQKKNNSSSSTRSSNRKSISVTMLNTIARILPLLSFSIKKMPLIIFLFAISWEIVASNSLQTAKDYFKGASNSSEESDYYEMNFAHPKNITIIPPKKKFNLVTIYLEGLEAAFTNEELYGRNLLQPLTSISNNNEISTHSFPNILQMIHGEQTTGGIVATQCGVSFISYTLRNRNKLGKYSKNLLAGTQCVNDILSDNGYYSVYMIPSKRKFGGILSFIQSHSYDESYGLNLWKQNVKYDENYDFSAWGIHDEDLVDEAIKKIDGLEKKTIPYNFVLFLLDTHEPNGLASKACKEQFGNNYQGVVNCQAFHTRRFIDHFIEKDYISDTKIVVMGDHLSRRIKGTKPIYDLGISNLERSVFNLWIAKKLPKPNRDKLSQYDVAASELEFLGFDVVGDKFGLGYSAWNETAIKFEATRIKEMQENFEKFSPTYSELWNPTNKY